jgi:hypothetical protein
MENFYDSINDSLHGLQAWKKKMMQERSMNSSDDESKHHQWKMNGLKNSNNPRESSSKDSDSWEWDPEGKNDDNGQEEEERSTTSSVSNSFLHESHLPPLVPKEHITFGKCSLCSTPAKSYVFVPCGHLCACGPCAQRTLTTTTCCPVCRKRAQKVMRVIML